MTIASTTISLEPEWAGVLLVGVPIMLGALAYFVRQTAATGLSEIKERIAELASHITALDERLGRLEARVDDVIIPRQSDIARKLHADRREHDGGIHD